MQLRLERSQVEEGAADALQELHRRIRTVSNVLKNNRKAGDKARRA